MMLFDEFTYIPFLYEYTFFLHGRKQIDRLVYGGNHKQDTNLFSAAVQRFIQNKHGDEGMRAERL